MKTEYKMPCGQVAAIETTPSPSGVRARIAVPVDYDLGRWLQTPRGWWQESSFGAPSRVADDTHPDGAAARAWTIERLRDLDAAIQAATVAAASRQHDADHCMDGLAI